jgi:AcrR family transcriptional regulator
MHVVTTPRADARRNHAAVLEAALRLFRTDPAATVGQVAQAAGVGRVTLYGHFPTREALVGAALSEAVARAERAVAAAGPATGDPAADLDRVLAAAWPALADGHGALSAACRELPAADVAARHEPVVLPLRAVLDRGIATGRFRGDLGVDWLVAAVSALVHAAAEQVAAGAADHDDATRRLVASVAAVVRTPAG